MRIRTSILASSVFCLCTPGGVLGDPGDGVGKRIAIGDSVAVMAAPTVAESMVVEMERRVIETARRRNEVTAADGSNMDFAESVRANIRARYGDRQPPADDLEVQTLKMIEAGEIWTPASSGHQRIRERWFIAADGAFRFDRTDARSEPDHGPAFDRTFVYVPTESRRPGIGPGTYELDRARQLYTVNPALRLRLCDLRRAGLADFEQPAIAGAFVGAQLRPSEALRVSAVAPVQPAEGPSADTLITVNSAGANAGRLFELVVDAEDATRCVESRSFHEAGALVRVVKNRDFRPTAGSSRPIPHEIEITDHKDGRPVRTDTLQIRRITIDPQAVEDAIREAAVCPQGWKRADSVPTTQKN